MESFQMKSFLRWWITVIALLFLAACGSDDDDDNGSATTGASNATPNQIVTSANSTLPSNTLAANLTGSQEAPNPTPSRATGTGIVMIDSATGRLKAVITTAGISNAISAHIHRGRPGEVGLPVITMTQAAPGTGVWVAAPTDALTQEQINDMRAGNYYFNVHSTTYPDGEIRGQILPQFPNDNATGTTGTGTTGTGTSGSSTTGSGSTGTDTGTTGTTGTGASGSSTTGSGSTGADTGTTGTTGTGTSGSSTTGSGSTGADTGTTGTTGTGTGTTGTGTTGTGTTGTGTTGTGTTGTGTTGTGTTGTGTTGTGTTGTGTTGTGTTGTGTTGTGTGTTGTGMTTAGMPDRTRFTTFVNVLTGTQQVPATTSTATAIGIVILDRTQGTMAATVISSGITGNAAHIHQGAAGVTDPSVVFSLVQVPVQGSTASGIWATRESPTTAQITTLMNGGYYFDIHSTAFPNGEIRGQIQMNSSTGTTGTGTTGTGTTGTGTTGTGTTGTGTTGTGTTGTGTTGTGTTGTGTTGTGTTGTGTTGTGTSSSGAAGTVPAGGADSGGIVGGPAT